MSPPDWVVRLMNERAERLTNDKIRKHIIARALIEAWCEGYAFREHEKP